MPKTPAMVADPSHARWRRVARARCFLVNMPVDMLSAPLLYFKQFIRNARFNLKGSTCSASSTMAAFSLRRFLRERTTQAGGVLLTCMRCGKQGCTQSTGHLHRFQLSIEEISVIRLLVQWHLSVTISAFLICPLKQTRMCNSLDVRPGA